MISHSYRRRGTRYTPIPRAQTVDLIRCAQKGGEKGKDAMQTLIEQNLGLVHTIAGRYDTRVLPAIIDRNDIIAEGLLGLMHAVRKFDPARGTQFSTYAVWWVRQKIQRFLQKQAPITTSIQVITRRERLQRVSDQFLSEYGRSPSLAEIAALTSLSPSQIERAASVPAVAFSLDGPAHDGQNRSADEIASDYVPAPDDLSPLVDRLDQAVLSDYLEQVLTPQQSQVLHMRLGLGSHTIARSDLAIALRLGLTQQRVGLIYQQALERLRQPAIARQLLALLTADVSADC